MKGEISERVVKVRSGIGALARVINLRKVPGGDGRLNKYSILLPTLTYGLET